MSKDRSQRASSPVTSSSLEQVIQSRTHRSRCSAAAAERVGRTQGSPMRRIQLQDRRRGSRGAGSVERSAESRTLEAPPRAVQDSFLDCLMVPSSLHGWRERRTGPKRVAGRPKQPARLCRLLLLLLLLLAEASKAGSRRPKHGSARARGRTGRDDEGRRASDGDENLARTRRAGKRGAEVLSEALHARWQLSTQAAATARGASCGSTNLCPLAARSSQE